MIIQFIHDLLFLLTADLIYTTTYFGVSLHPHISHLLETCCNQNMAMFETFRGHEVVPTHKRLIRQKKKEKKHYGILETTGVR